MGTRGRKSSVELALAVIEGKRPLLTAPRHLTKRERKEFDEIVAAANHLTQSDIPLIAALAQATLLARSLAKDVTKVGQWEKAIRAQTMLARSLRLTPQSRIDPKTAGRRSASWPTGPAPW